MRNDMTLLSIARADLRIVRLILDNLSEDESDLNLAAYHVQQALEKAMKHKQEIKGITPKYSHDLEDIYNSNQELFLDMSESLVDRLAKITTWEAKTRYIKGYTTEKKTVENLFSLVEDYLNGIDESESKVKQTKMFGNV